MRKPTKGARREPRARGERQRTNEGVTTVGSADNVFAALELPDADEWLAKAELARAIAGEIDRRGLTQMEAATTIGVAQSDVSNLARGRLAGYSMERLYRFLNMLGQDVRIVVQPKPERAPARHCGRRFDGRPDKLGRQNEDDYMYSRIRGAWAVASGGQTVALPRQNCRGTATSTARVRLSVGSAPRDPATTGASRDPCGRA